MAVLEAKNLGIAFGGLRALQDVQFSIGEKEIIGLIGPNGAGKTTVFNLLTDVYVPTEGTITLENQNIVGKKTYQITQGGISRTFQNIRLFKDISVIDNVKIAMNFQMKYSVLSGIFRLPAWMNPTETKELMETIRLIRDRFGIAILLIEHDMNFVMGICERIYVLDYGKVIAEGNPEEIRNNPRVITAYLGGE